MKKTFLPIFTCSIFILSSFLFIEKASATWSEGMQEAEKYATKAGLSQEKEEDILVAVMDYLTDLIAPLFIVLIVIAGIIYVAAGGTKPELATLAQNILTYAIIGLVITLLAFIILRFISDTAYSNTSGGTGGSNNFKELAEEPLEVLGEQLVLKAETLEGKLAFLCQEAVRLMLEETFQ